MKGGFSILPWWSFFNLSTAEPGNLISVFYIMEVPEAQEGEVKDNLILSSSEELWGKKRGSREGKVEDVEPQNEF